MAETRVSYDFVCDSKSPFRDQRLNKKLNCSFGIITLVHMHCLDRRAGQSLMRIDMDGNEGLYNVGLARTPLVPTMQYQATSYIIVAFNKQWFKLDLVRLSTSKIFCTRKQQVLLIRGYGSLSLPTRDADRKGIRQSTARAYDRAVLIFCSQIGEPLEHMGTHIIL